MEPYKLSPTQGTIPPEKIVGRKKELGRLQKTLESQSVVIEEIRRMGKTLFLQKYEYIAPKNQKVLYFTVQGTKDVNELTDKLIERIRIEQSQGKLQIPWTNIKKLYNTAASAEVDINGVSFKLPEWKTKWKDAFEACLRDIAFREKTNDNTLIIILDELPIMIWDWIQQGRIEETKEFLDVLRKNRQLLENTGKVRFVICGSIGMEVVLKKLKEDYHYTGEPFNDAAPFEIGAMSIDDAMFLSRCLLLDGYAISEGEEAEILLQQLNGLAECLPYYINWLFSIIRNDYDSILSYKNIIEAYEDLLNRPNYSKVLKQLEERITIYYSMEEGDNMKEVLNLLSKSEESLGINKIIEKLTFDEKTVKSVLYTLLSENYLTRKMIGEEKHFAFKYNLVKKWWGINMA